MTGINRRRVVSRGKHTGLDALISDDGLGHRDPDLDLQLPLHVDHVVLRERRAHRPYPVGVQPREHLRVQLRKNCADRLHGDARLDGHIRLLGALHDLRLRLHTYLRLLVVWTVQRRYRHVPTVVPAPAANEVNATVNASGSRYALGPGSTQNSLPSGSAMVVIST